MYSQTDNLDKENINSDNVWQLIYVKILPVYIKIWSKKVLSSILLAFDIA